MENEETFIMLDENGQERNARILDVVEMNGQDYVVYALERNEDEETVYVQKIIKDQNGEENIVSITDEEEKRKVFEAIREGIEELD